MGRRKVRPMLFIAAGIVIAALIGLGVWYTGSPSSNDGISTKRSDALPSSHTANITTSATQDEPRGATPTSAEDIAHQTPYAEPDENDPFLPPNARLAAPSSIERETNVYRPTNVVPDGSVKDGSAQDRSVPGDSSQGDLSTEPGGSSHGDTLASASRPGAADETQPTRPVIGTETPGTTGIPSSTAPGASTDQVQTQPSTPPLPPQESSPPADSNGFNVQADQQPEGQPAQTESAPAPTQSPAQQEPTVVPAPQQPAQEQAPQGQPQTQQQQVSQPQLSNFGNDLWWQQLQSQFIR
ncbi:hypothetical protein ACXZ66_03810 [Corynebacterium sp. S7]